MYVTQCRIDVVYAAAIIFLRWTFISSMKIEIQTSTVQERPCNLLNKNLNWPPCRYISNTNTNETTDVESDSRNMIWCPIGFQLGFSNNERVCFKKKGLEKFSEYYKDCSHNIFSSELYKWLHIDKSTAVWSEYKNAYLGGPFINTLFSRHLHQELNSNYRVIYQNRSRIFKEDLCIVIHPENGYMAVSCDDKYSRYCVIKPKSIDNDNRFINPCRNLGQMWLSYSSPVPICLKDIKIKEGVEFYETEIPEKLCKNNRGTSLINKGWLYANHPRFEYKNNLIAVTESDYSLHPEVRSSITSPEYTYLIYNETRMKQSNYIFYDFICERSIDSKKVDLHIKMSDTDKGLMVVFKNSNSTASHDIYCFNDSLPTFPNGVKIKADYMKPDGDGYFWCIYKDPITSYTTESNKFLYIRDEKSLENVYAVKFRVNKTSNSNNLDNLYRRHAQNLVNYFKCHNIFLGKVELDFHKQYVFHNKLYKNSDNKYLVYVKAKRKYLDGTFLYHVKLHLNGREVPLRWCSEIEVIQFRPVYYCKAQVHGQTLPRKLMNDIITINGIKFKCSGDFNEGVEWMKIVNGEKQLIAEMQRMVSNPVSVDNISTVFYKANDFFGEKQKPNNSGQLLHLLDQLGSTVKLNKSHKLTKTIGSNLALLVADADVDNEIWGFSVNVHNNSQFTNDSFNFITEMPDPYVTFESKTKEAMVVLPASVVKSKSRCSFVVLRNGTAFSSSPADRPFAFVNSLIISVTVLNFTQFKKGEVIDIHFNPLRRNMINETRACAYWHFNDNDDKTGYWSQDGCVIIEATRPGMLDTCRCSHLTYFAEILIPRIIISEADESALEIISVIGCCLSILGLIIVVVTAVVFKTWRQQFCNKIWLQLCIVILIRSVCFLIVVFVKFENDNTLCVLVGIALHYSLLCSFCWMLVAAVISYRKLVLVFTREPSHKLLRACAFSYGAPFVVIAILLSADRHSYEGSFENMAPTGSFCYPSGLGLWLAVYAPVAVFILINWTLFVLIIRSVFASKKVQRYGNSNEALRCASVSCLLVFLFGLPCVTVIFNYSIVAAYILTVTATFQGFILFMFFVLLNSDTRTMWINKIKLSQKVSEPNSTSNCTHSNVFIIRKNVLNR